MTEENEPKPEPKPNYEEDSKYGKGFAFRMTILLGLLALVAAGLFYDRVVLPKMAKATIDEAYKLMVAPDKDGHGITKDQVQKTIGFAPEAKTTIDGYDIETYSFKRALPFMKGDYLNVIYENGALIQILQNKEYSPDAVKSSLGFRSAAGEDYTGNKVQLGGVPPSSLPGANDEDDEDEDSDDEDSDEDSDEGDDDDEDDDDSDEDESSDDTDEESGDEDDESEGSGGPG